MYFIVVLLLLLAVGFALFGYRHHEHEFVFMAWCFVLAAFGSGMILLFATEALNV
ncbi:MAG: hypothetical protein UY72_C0001G0013 [Candidatus Uhrbacteria bacterium GW2011_GWD2_52_7]|uniref:Uncharacterized protein n=1 Tax=Candidatus Uhrbacteria bacterium GW2011_GWD2_52_7 TaxID=1618989 RepID=A0A0G1XIW6_9BACT|nr:MAG: hypothetical protein UY72_C0001G0013 [Candidatus Uhrbacteria bacterium GW2011_GWD2_52_7]